MLIMQDWIKIIIWVVLIGGTFIYLWRTGQLVRFTTYIAATREELRKCTWPTWEELKGSTLVVGVCILLLGGFTVLVDFVFSLFVRWIT